MKEQLERILVIDDEPGMCRLLDTVLTEEGYLVTAIQRPQEAVLSLKKDNFDLVITDLRMPKIDGIEILQTIKSVSPDIPVILVTAYSSVESAVKAMKLGASDYVAKPFKNDEIKMVVANVLEKSRLREENKRLKKELASRYQFCNIIGKSKKMQDVFRLISQVSQAETTALIQGESGTGKELVARAIHFNGPRDKKSFIAIHCGGLSETMLESELFGHIKGAFTDALKDRKGLLESADSGTVFLDEVGDMPPSLQVKLLRFIQEREIRRLGSDETKRIDVHLIAATNKNLQQEVKMNRFREDLYYRLAVIPVFLPPLRERMEDIPLLVQHFLKKYMKKTEKKETICSPDALQCILAYNWPGNIRELENAIEHAMALTTGSVILQDHLPKTCAMIPPLNHYPAWENQSYRVAKQKVLESFNKTYLTSILTRANSNITHAAQMSGMNRKNFYDLLKKNDLMPNNESSSA